MTKPMSDHLRVARKGLMYVAGVGLAVGSGLVAGQQAPAPDLRTLDPSLQQERTFESEEYFREQPRQREQDPLETPPDITSQGLPETGVAFELKEIRINESELLPMARIRELIAGYEGREVSFADINELVDGINDLYASEGLVNARAIVPPQQIRNGILTLRLVEGRLGKVVITNEIYNREGVVRWGLPTEPGEVVDVRELRPALTRINRTSNFQLRAALAAGEQPGETDIRLSVDEQPRLTGQAFVDNAGSETTGEERVGASLVVNGPLRIDDRMTLFVVGSEGSLNGLFSYDAPVNRWGGRVGARLSQGDIEIVQGPFEALNVTGDSREIAVRWDQPWYSGDTVLVQSYLENAAIESTTELEGQAISEFDVDRWSLGAQINGYLATANWHFRQGVVQAEVENVFGATDDYLLYEGEASWVQAFGGGFLGLFRAGWQFAEEDTVPPTLLFQSGGAGSVRGYPSGAVAGADGLFASAELRYRWRQALEPFAFTDYGQIKDVSPASEELHSLGAGLRWQYGDHLSGELYWGQTLRDVVPDQDSGKLQARISYQF
ncbi:MAG TPA: ShlB/FhaC/HecB family hemolysin secretion/activation protein [Marinobacter sp.]|nr:ShlB/FhaC/HecB family hemolysin secretion/activation protein [Marinobacter sp.]